MARNEGQLLPWVVLGLVGISAGSSLVPRRNSAPEPALPAAPAAARTSVSEARDAGPLAGARPALLLLLEHLGARAKGPSGGGGPASLQAHFCAEGSCPPAAETHVRLSLDLPPGSRAERQWRKLVEADEDAEVLLERLSLALRANAPSALAPLQVRFVIATVPDYVDSNSAWMFDGILDAMQRAAGAAGYVLEGFHLPDWTPEAKPGAGSSEERRTHEREPGAVLFRHRLTAVEIGRLAPSARPADLLMLLLATETATSGIHKKAFTTAAALSARVAPGAPLLVLGPSFSGSTPSLMSGLGTVREFLPAQAPKPRVRILSGSATNFSNLERLETQVPGMAGEIRFRATTATDDDHLEVLRDYLKTLDPDWFYGEKMVLLQESNTGWGLSFRGDPDHQSCRFSKRPFACAQVATFPLHISRLRGPAAARMRPMHEAAASEGGISLGFEESSPPRDRIPSLTPEMTAATVEIALARLLDSLHSLPVTAIGIMGTDKRDHLFLAQEISRRCPDVLLFSLEGSLLYLNSDFRPYLRGTLVASSYPLFSLTQALVDPPPARRPLVEFSSMGEAGVYNALLAFLGQPERMLDYGRLGSPTTFGPKVWLGVVGQDAIWPLAERQPTVRNTYSWRPEGSANGDQAAAPKVELHWPRSAMVLFGLVGLATLAHALLLWGAAATLLDARTPDIGTGRRLSRWLRRVAPIFEPPDLRARRWRRMSFRREPKDGGLEPPAQRPSTAREASLRQEYWFAVLACSGALFCLVTWTGGLLRAGGDSIDCGTVLTDALLGILGWIGTSWRRDLLGVLVALGALGAVVPTPLRLKARVMALTAFRLFPVGVGLFTLWQVRSVAEGDLLRGDLAPLNALRMASLGNFVSPTSVVLCFAGFAYLWGIWGLRRVHLQAARFDQGSPVFRLLGGDDPTGKRQFLDALNQPSLRLGPGPSILLGLFVGLQLTLGWHLGRALDGPAMGRLIVAGTMFSAFVVGHTLAHSLRLGVSLLRSLRSLNLHPVGQAFGRVAREPFLWHFSLGIPDGRALAPLVRQAAAVSLAARSWGKDLEALARAAPSAAPSAPAPPAPPAERRQRRYDAPEVVHPDSRAAGLELHIRAGDVEAFLAPHVLTSPVVREFGRDIHLSAPFQTTATWQRLEELSYPVRLALARGPWARAPYPAAPSEPRGAREGAPAPKAAETTSAAFYREAETFLALELAYALRQVLVRLLSGLTVALAGLLLVLCAHLFYMFQGRMFWLTVDWLALGAGAAAAVALLVKLEKDAVLSRLWSTRPGHVDWNGEFVGRMVVYGALPVLTLFATFFPEVGQSLFGWLEPVKKALPY